MFTNDKKKYHQNNLEIKIKQFENCLNKWKLHKLSLIGKITVIKTFALPKLVYPLTVLNIPSEEILNQIKNACSTFYGMENKIKLAGKQ